MPYERYNAMRRKSIETDIFDRFTHEFGCQPTVVVKAPGRVNLIGEHTDYNGLPVMPIAIPYTITVTLSPRDDATIVLRNTDPQFPPSQFTLSVDIPHSAPGDWSNYVKAAANELTGRLKTPLKGYNALYHGDLPSSAGLSSSSALVIASALSLLAANKIDMNPIDLAEAMAFGEHYVGTQGGGMDQAISLLGHENNAVKIDFFPLRSRYVPFPKNHSIIVAHSLVRAAKTENALLLYNRRPAECRLATAILNALYPSSTPLARLGDAKNREYYTAEDDGLSMIDNVFTEDFYSLEMVSIMTGNSPESLVSKYLLTRSGVPMPVPPDGFLIRQRALHVFSEAGRVEKSADALVKNNAQAFGDLMNQSHASCASLYGISTQELDALVAVMRESGALGARLTGAGFGGCAIALVTDDKREAVMAAIHESYYGGYIAVKRPDLFGSRTCADSSLVFTVKPGDGAQMYYL